MVPPLVVTDWALISAQKNAANLLRKFPSGTTPQKELPVTNTSSVGLGVNVCSTGRTSGYQCGQVGEIPAYINDAKAGKTREWFVEEPESSDDEDDWIRGGMGVQGGSGAAIINCETNALMGQLWGRNTYFGPGPRLTIFTPILDVFDDIQERFVRPSRPQLPQNDHDETRCWPVYPVCRRCFDLHEDSNRSRSLRESPMSMIAGAGDEMQSDDDLDSVSELATPQAGGDPTSRFPRFDEALATLGYASRPQMTASPPSKMIFQSPYPEALQEEDLYEPGPPEDVCTAVRRRAAYFRVRRACNVSHNYIM